MPTVHVQAESAADLQDIADLLWKAKKVVVITGAGISTNSGIPDFRSENGLYSMIQSQFDAAAKLESSQPQVVEEESRSHDRDDRPRKRRKTTPPVEESIDVKTVVSSNHNATPIDDENAASSEPEAQRRALREDMDEPKSNNLGHKPSKAETAAETIRQLHCDGDNGRSLTCSNTDNVEDKEEEEEEEEEEEVVLLSEDSVLVDGFVSSQTHEARSAQVEAPGPPIVPVNCNTGMENKAVEPYQMSPAAPLRKTPGNTSLTLPATCSSPSITAITKLPQRLPLYQGDSSSSGPSTPKQTIDLGTQTNTSSSPLSSPPQDMFDPFEDQSFESQQSSTRPSSPVSQNDGDGDGEEGAPSSQAQANRSQIFRRSLSTLKGRELFDASIWSDPLKTSVFYTFATNLRQKSRDASPTGCHHFISHLKNAGKMVRCYTQNIDLLEDKVGLSTRLMLGPGSRSRFSARAQRSLAGNATPRNSVNPNNEAGPVPAVDRPSVSGDASASSQDTVDDQPTSQAVDPVSSSEGVLSNVVESANDNRGAEGGGQESTQGSSCQIQDQEGEAKQDTECGKDNTISGTQPIDAAPSTGSQQIRRAESGLSSPEPDRGVECVYLHGSLRGLRCFQCGCIVDWDEGDRELQTLSGQQPPCPRCEDATAARQERGKRALGVGKLRPDIVLYGEDHPESQRISDIIEHDLSLAPDMLIIMGTSLKVHGLKTVVREFAKTVHNKKDGRVIFINFSKPAESVWADIIDFWVEMDCDAWVQDLKEKKPMIWLPPGSVIEDESRTAKRRRPVKDDAERKENKKSRKSEVAKEAGDALDGDVSSAKKVRKIQKEESSKVSKPEPKRPAAFRDCKANGAYWTMKIIADLASISGRELRKLAFVRPAPKELVPLPQVPSLQPASSVAPDLNTTAPTQPPKSRRRPRTKNTKSRNLDARAVALKSTEGLPKPAAQPGKFSAERNDKSGTKGQAKEQKSISEPAALPATDEGPPGPPLEEAPMQSSVAGMGDAVSEKERVTIPGLKDEAALGEVPPPNTQPDSTGENNSILAAVKSKHRIRKPKAIFGETGSTYNKPSSRRSMPASSSAIPKVKSKLVRARKQKAGRKTETPNTSNGLPDSQDDVGIQQSRVAVLPDFPARPPPIQVYMNHQGSQRPETLDERTTLAPMRNSGEHVRDDGSAKAVGSSNASTGFRHPHPSELSPSALSPDHWRKIAFTFAHRGPVWSHFEGPAAVQLNDGPQGPALARPQAVTHRAVAQPALAEAPKLFHGPGGVSILSPPVPTSSALVDDSPSRQLHDENQASRESEAAAALMQFRSPPIFDERRFARIEAGV